MDDDAQLRRRIELLRLSGLIPAAGLPRRRFRVIDGGNIPTAVPRVFWAVPMGRVVGSSPAEGVAIDSTPPADELAQPVVVIGPDAPTAGKQLMAYRINGQWVADYSLDAAATPDPTGPNVCCNSCATGRNQLLWPSTLTVTGPSGGGTIAAIPDAFGCIRPLWTGVIRVSCPGIKLVTAVSGTGATYCRLPDINACCTDQTMQTITACVTVGLGCVKIGANYYWQLGTSFMFCQECPYPVFPIGCGAHGLIPIELCGSHFNLGCGGGSGSAPCGEGWYGGVGGSVSYLSGINQTTSSDLIPATSINCREPRALSYSVSWPGSAGYATVTVEP